MALEIATPQPDEYAPFYAGYIHFAQARGDVLAALPQQITDLKSTLGHLSDAQVRFKPGPKEWSIKEVIGHLNDGERVFSYRLAHLTQ